MLLNFEKVSFSYANSEKVLSDVTFSLSHGEKVALLGLNGAGKSTLMLHTNGLLLPSEGDVTVNGINTRSKSLDKVRKAVGIVFQNPDDQLFMPTVREDVAFGPKNMKISDSEINERVEKALILTRTRHLADKSPFELSGGQKKMVSIATVLSMSPDLLVLDEPTAGLDYVATQDFISIIESLPQAILLSTHDLNLAKRLCSRSIYLEKGRIVPMLTHVEVNTAEMPVKEG